MIMPASGQDIFNYLASYYASNHQLHMVLEFPGHLNEKQLKQAVKLTIEQEPVLGCNFVEDEKRAYFINHPDLDITSVCTVQETNNPDTALRHFIAQSIDSRFDPLVQVQLIRTINRDTLCIKLDHTCSDAGGLKAYTYMLADIYSQLDLGEVMPTEKSAVRDCSEVFEFWGIDDLNTAFDPGQMPPGPDWAFPHRSYDNQHPGFVRQVLPPTELKELKYYAWNHDATINDILLTCFYRALHQIVGKAASIAPVSVTADLRRYLLAKSRMVAANASSSFTASIPAHVGESATETLKRVTAVTREARQQRTEAPLAILMEMFGYMDFAAVKNWFRGAREQALASGLSTPHLSNIGVINEVNFGEQTAVDGYIVGPAMFAPGFMLVVSTYGQKLSLVINTYASDIDPQAVEQFCDLMSKELHSFIA